MQTVYLLTFQHSAVFLTERGRSSMSRPRTTFDVFVGGCDGRTAPSGVGKLWIDWARNCQTHFESLAVFWSTSTSFYATANVCEAVTAVTTYKELTYKTRYSSTTADHSPMKLR